MEKPIVYNAIECKECNVPKGWGHEIIFENDETLNRKDADVNEINRMLKDPSGYCKIWREFQTTNKPHHWVVWPHSKSKGWCDRITGNL